MLSMIMHHRNARVVLKHLHTIVVILTASMAGLSIFENAPYLTKWISTTSGSSILT